MKTLKVMFTSVGRRVELINLFKNTAQKMGYQIVIIGADHDFTSPALFFVDKVYRLPYKIDDQYVKHVYEICKNEAVDLLVPLIDPELPVFSKYKELFREIGTFVAISDYETVSIVRDKLNFYNFLSRKNFSFKIPQTVVLKNFLPENFPSSFCILKPRYGSSSRGIFSPIKKTFVPLVKDVMNLDEEEYIVQEFIDFETEVTVDVFVDGKHNVVELCQRKRLKIRGGEVERAVTIKNPLLSTYVKELVEKLNFWGVINVQFLAKKDTFYLTEVNPRFGGGYPLSHYAKANLIEHLIKLATNQQVTYFFDRRYKENCYMLRYDLAVYTNERLGGEKTRR